MHAMRCDATRRDATRCAAQVEAARELNETIQKLKLQLARDSDEDQSLDQQAIA
jgi:hypothetical protein